MRLFRWRAWVRLRYGLRFNRMPDRVGPFGVLYREEGKQPPLFGPDQIQALLDELRPELEAGNPPGHREADERRNTLPRARRYDRIR